MSYRIPENALAEIGELEAYIAQFQAGTLDGAALKARRVPFGCYEQRQDGTYMVRVRTAGGYLTPAQMEGLADIAERHGRADFLHVTTRQEFQIHDLDLAQVAPVMRAVVGIGLSSRGGGGNTVRNIMVSPEAGIGKDEVFDPTPHAFALTSRLVAEADSWLLPRKLKITFSNSPADTAYAQFNDVGFIATIKDGVKGFRVHVAGGMGNKPEQGHLLHQFVTEGEVYFVAEAVKRLFDKHGNRKNRHAARLRFLWKTLGEARFLELYQAERDALAAEGAAPLAVEPLPPQAAAPQGTPLATDDPAFAAWKARYAEPQVQDGLYTVLVPIFLGNIKTEQARALAQALAPLGDHVLRATLGQNLRLRNIPEAWLGTVWAAVKTLGEALPRPLANSIACTGADTCKLGICLPRGGLAAVARKLSKSKLPLEEVGEFHLNLSGCPNSCGQHMLADLGFFGNAGRKDQRMYPAYSVVAGARIAEGEARMAKQLGRVAARDLPAAVEDILGRWIARKGAYADFAAYVDGEGSEDIKAVLASYAEVPDFEDDKNYYFDWGADDVFSLVGRGIGECSAGLFDLIDVDLKGARKLVDEAPAAGLAAETLYRVTLMASRALMITRGIEAPTDQAVFANFARHFVEANLVDARFAPLVALAASGDKAALAARSGEILDLLAAIEALYQSMDNSLRFPAELQTQAAPAPAAPLPAPAILVAAAKADVEKDYRGVACPMNFVKVKLDLATMEAGQTLKVILGDGDPIRNVPRSVEEEGHKVLSQTMTGEVWEVVIRKVGD